MERSRPPVRLTQRAPRRRLDRVARRRAREPLRLARPSGLRPAGVRPAVVRPASPPRRAAGLRLTLIVWWRGAELDRRLAAGENPSASDALAMRASRITAVRHRRRVADGLERALQSARKDGGGFSAAVRPYYPDVLEAGPLIATIGRRLRGPAPVSPRGVAIVRSLLIDANGPLYQPDEPGALGSQLRAAAAALRPAGAGRP